MSGNGIVANISCRKGCDGTDVADAVWYMGTQDTLVGVEEFVLLVHGYNDHRSYAQCAYEKFIQQCDAISEGAFTSRFKIVTLQWPGDQLNPVKGVVDYPGSLEHAIGSSAILATFLAGLATLQAARKQTLRVHWVAHSLGNRVVLETIAALRGAEVGIQFPTLAMLASAVRSNMLEKDTYLRSAALAPDSTAVLHSTGDDVLRWAFPPGQTISGDGFFPEALGHNGDPSSLTHNSQAFNWFGHSDYWFSPYSVAYVLSALGLAVDRNVIPSGTANYVAPQANATPSNTTASRSTPVWIPTSRSSKFQNPCEPKQS